MSLCALFSATTKTIDALTVVRLLKRIIGEENATIQYGILNGKVDTLIMFPLSFNIAFATTLVPTISRGIAKKQLEDVKRKIKYSLLITTLIGLPCTIVMNIFSNEFIKILFPNASLGGELLRISSYSIIFILLTQTINGALQGLGKVITPVIEFAIGSIIKLIFNILLIPIYRINGAIFSTIIYSIVIILICFIKLKRSINIKFNIKNMLRRKN